MSPGLVAGARVLPAAVLRSDVSPLLSAGFRRAASTVVLSGWARVGPAPGPAAPSPGTVALAPLALVVALRTRWPTDDEHAAIGDRIDGFRRAGPA